MIMGEWGTEGFQSIERSSTVKGIGDALSKHVPDLYLKVLISGLLAIIGCFTYEEGSYVSLEVFLPIVGENGTEVDLAMMDHNSQLARELNAHGYYLMWDRQGALRAFKELPEAGLEEEIDFLSQKVSTNTSHNCQ